MRLQDFILFKQYHLESTLRRCNKNKKKHKVVHASTLQDLHVTLLLCATGTYSFHVSGDSSTTTSEMPAAATVVEKPDRSRLSVACSAVFM